VLSGSESLSEVEAWLDEVEALLDRPRFSDAKTVLPDLEARAGSELEQMPRYLLLRGRARYLCDRNDEARVDYDRAWGLSGRGTELAVWVCVRLGQLLFHDDVDDAMRWAALGCEEVAGLQHSHRLLGEVAELEGRILWTQGMFDQAGARFLDAEKYFSDIQCWHRAVQALRFRLEIDAESDQSDGDVSFLKPDQLRVFVTKVKVWGVDPAEWISDVVGDAVVGSIVNLQPGVEQLLEDIGEEIDCLLPAEAPFLLGEIAMLEGRILRTQGLLDQAEVRFLDAEDYLSGIQCRIWVLDTVWLRLELDAERDQTGGDWISLNSDQLRTFMTSAKGWDVDPAEWVPRVVKEARRGSFEEIQPGVVQLFGEIAKEYDQLVPNDERVFVGRIMKEAGETDSARHHLVLAAQDDGNSDGAWLARIYLALIEHEETTGDSGRLIRELLQPRQLQNIEGYMLALAGEDLAKGGFPEEGQSVLEYLIGRPGEDKEIIDSAKACLAGCLLNVGETTRAHKLLENVAQGSFDDSLGIGGVLILNQGLVALMQGCFEKALNYSVQGVETIRAVGNKSWLGQALILAANSAYLLDKPSLAVSFLEELDLLEGDLSQKIRAGVHMSWGKVLQDLGQPEAALEKFKVGLRIGKTQGDVLIRASALLGIAEVLCELGQLEDAARAALVALKSMPGMTHLRGRARYLRGVAMQGLNKRERSEAHFRRAAKDYHQSGMFIGEAECWDWVALLNPDPKKRVLFVRRAVRLAGAALCFVNERRSRLAMRDRTRPFGIRWVASLLESRDFPGALAAACEVKASEFLGLLRGTHQETKSIDRELILAMTKATENGAAFTGKTTLSPVALRHMAVDENGAPPNAIETFHAFTGPQTPAADARVKPQRILRRLNQDEAAVEYFLTDPFDGYVLIFVSHRGRVRCHERRWRVRHADALRMLPNVVQGLSHGGDVGLLQSWFRVLHDVLVKPLGMLPDRVTRLWLAPGGLLEQVPFEALIDAEGRTLLERVETTRLLTTAQLALLPRRRPAVKHALVLRGSDDRQAALHHAEAECAEVRVLAQGAGVNLIDQVDEKTLATVDLLHYAGHASFEPDSPDAGAIFLAGRKVTARDLIDMPLKARPTVVLSACESGRTETGTDEFGGFLRAFFAAGATDVVCSGWLADDATTRDTMSLFYEGFLCQGQRPTEALRAAALEVRKNRPHPFHWANFRCYGLG